MPGGFSTASDRVSLADGGGISSVLAGHAAVLTPLLVTLAFATTGAILRVPILTLYRRLARSRVLENPARRALYEYVRAHPGASCAEAARATGVHFTTAKRHLRILAEFQHVTAHATTVGRRYFENHGRYSGNARSDLSLLARPENARFLTAVACAPSAGIGELARSLGLAKSTASRRAALLRSHGLVEGDAAGGFTVTPRAVQALLARVAR